MYDIPRLPDCRTISQSDRVCRREKRGDWRARRGSDGGRAENTCLTLHTADSVNGKYLPNARSAWLPSQPVPALSAYAYQKASSLVPALYDNLKIAVAKICVDGKRERTWSFTELVSHYLFADRFGRSGKGNDKGKVEGLVKYARANFMTPVPEAASFDALNAMLAECCRRRQDDHAGRHAGSISERLAADRAVLRALPTVPLEPCEKRADRVSSTSLVRYRGNDYSVSTIYGFRDVVCFSTELERQPEPTLIY